MDILPFWVRGVALGLCLPLTVEIGYRIHRLVSRSLGGDTGDGWGRFATASLTLLTLLLALTVSSASGRYEERRLKVVDEANAISTTYRRAQLFEDPARSALSAQLDRYAAQRRATVLAIGDDARAQQAAAATQATQDRLWATTTTALRQPGAGTLTVPFLVAINGMFESAASTRGSLEAKTPGRVIVTLVAISLVTALLVGFGLGYSGRRYPVMSAIVFVTVAMTVMLVVDLDKAGSGIIHTTTAPLERVSDSISRSEKAKVAAVAATPIPNAVGK